jgi:hypothetical protein
MDLTECIFADNVPLRAILRELGKLIMKHLRSTMLSGALAVLGILPLGTTLSHADTKVMAGGDCFSASDGSFRTGGGRLAYTKSTGSLLVLCYPVRDSPTLKPTKVEVSVVDNSSAATGVRDISCFMRLANRFGTSFSVGATRSTVGVVPGGTILNLPIPAATLADGTISIVCTLPRRGVGDIESWIASIKWIEPNEPGT